MELQGDGMFPRLFFYLCEGEEDEGFERETGEEKNLKEMVS